MNLVRETNLRLIDVFPVRRLIAVPCDFVFPRPSPGSRGGPAMRMMLCRFTCGIIIAARYAKHLNLRVIVVLHHSPRFGIGIGIRDRLLVRRRRLNVIDHSFPWMIAVVVGRGIRSLIIEISLRLFLQSHLEKLVLVQVLAIAWHFRSFQINQNSKPKYEKYHLEIKFSINFIVIVITSTTFQRIKKKKMVKKEIPPSELENFPKSISFFRWGCVWEFSKYFCLLVRLLLLYFFEDD